MGLSAIPQIGQIPGLQSALDAHTSALAGKAALSGATFTGAVTCGNGTLVARGLGLGDAQSVSLAATWVNPATAFTALHLNVTDAASASDSFLADLKVGGVSKFSVRKDGYFSATSALLGGVSFYGSGNFAAGNTGWNYGMARNGVKLTGTNGGMVGWAAGSLDAATDLGLARASAGVLEVNNGTPGTLAALTAAGGTLGGVSFYGSGSFAAVNTGWNYGMARNGVKLAGTDGGMVGWAAGSLDAATDLGLARSSAGVLEVNNGTPGTPAYVRVLGVLDSAGSPVVGSQQAAVADATDAASAITQLNALLACLRAHGLIAT